MNIIKSFLVAIFLISSCPSWCQQESNPVPTDEDAAYIGELLEGRRLVQAGNPDQAITKYFDEVISEFDAKYDRSETRIFCARSPEESFAYLVTAAADEQSAEVLSSTWADAHFLKGYALLELGRLTEAKSSIEQAVVLSPYNSQYHSELGHIYQLEKDWHMALQYFQDAERFAVFSPPASKSFELGVARRGAGYVFVELGRLEEAEEKYLLCLAEDPDDVRAKNELEYVRNLQRSQ
jgi:tetratricopeptide (TPR) repeat protein